MHKSWRFVNQQLIKCSLYATHIRMKQFEIESYITKKGKAPFLRWLERLKDNTAKTKLYARIDRASYGNFGDWKTLKNAKGVHEMREHYGQGYRIYYSIVGQNIILLLAGSTKKDQSKAIAKAKEYLADYKRRIDK